MKLYRKSRNLIQFPYLFDTVTSSDGGATIKTNNDGSLTFNGSTSKSIFARLSKVYLKAGETYYLSWYSDTAFEDLKGKVSVYVNGLRYTVGRFTATEDGEVEIHAVLYKGYEIDNITIYPMLNEGETALPYEPYAGQRIKLLYGSKNLINVDEIVNDCFVKNDDGSFTLSKINGGWDRFSGKFYVNLPAGTYYASCILIDKTTRGLSIRAGYTDGTYSGNFTLPNVKVTFDKQVEYLQLFISYDSTVGQYYTFKDFRLNKGDTAQPYDKYFPLSKMNLYLKSRNLIHYPYAHGNKEQNGLTITQRADGGVYVKGTCTKNTVYYLQTQYAWFSNYTQTFVNGAPISKEGFCMSLVGIGDIPVTAPMTRLSYEVGGNVLYLYFIAGGTYDCTFYPMLNAGEVALPYEPPQKYPN